MFDSYPTSKYEIKEDSYINIIIIADKIVGRCIYIYIYNEKALVV